jgi:hypothetical protein
LTSSLWQSAAQKLGDGGRDDLQSRHRSGDEADGLALFFLTISESLNGSIRVAMLCRNASGDMMAAIFNNTAHWRARAFEARHNAEQIPDGEAKTTMLEIAAK